jgi:hypothetical protein
LRLEHLIPRSALFEHILPFVLILAKKGQADGALAFLRADAKDIRRAIDHSLGYFVDQ